MKILEKPLKKCPKCKDTWWDNLTINIKTGIGTLICKCGFKTKYQAFQEKKYINIC